MSRGGHPPGSTIFPVPPGSTKRGPINIQFMGPLFSFIFIIHETNRLYSQTRASHYMSASQTVCSLSRGKTNAASRRLFFLTRILYNSLGFHSVSNLQEAGNVSTGNIVAFHAILLSSFIKVMEDVNHDLL